MLLLLFGFCCWLLLLVVVVVDVLLDVVGVLIVFVVVLVITLTHGQNRARAVVTGQAPRTLGVGKTKTKITSPGTLPRQEDKSEISVQRNAV